MSMVPGSPSGQNGRAVRLLLAVGFLALIDAVPSLSAAIVFADDNRYVVVPSSADLLVPFLLLFALLFILGAGCSLLLHRWFRRRARKGRN